MGLVFRVGMALVLSLAFTAVSASDINDGRIKSTICAGCHGVKGKSHSGLWPNLAGQRAPYLIKALRDFRDGRRFDRVMNAMAEKLSDKDIYDLAAYYESLGE